MKDGVEALRVAEEDSKRSKKELKRLLGENRPLDPWERYRALTDAMDEAYELIDIANREARFALILMGALNAGLFVVGTRGDLISTIPAWARPWTGLLLLVYAAVGVYFLLQAIETLRPRKFFPRLPPGSVAPDAEPVGVRYFEDVVKRDAAGHWRAWREVRVAQLNAELAAQGHSLSLKNTAKYAALRRVYGGLTVMTALAAGLLTLLAFFAFTAAGR